MITAAAKHLPLRFAGRDKWSLRQKCPGPHIDTGAGFRTVLVRVSPAGVLDLAYGDRVLADGLQLPNYSFITGGKFGFYANTGGENENHWVDNINLQPTKSSAPLGIATQPADVSVLEGRTATFTVQLTDPVGATYQWSKNGTAIPGHSSFYTTPATVSADNGATSRSMQSDRAVPLTAVNAVLTVIQPITITNPQVTFDFNDGQLPFLPPPNDTVQTILNAARRRRLHRRLRRRDNSGVLKLTDADQTVRAVRSWSLTSTTVSRSKRFTAYFAVRVGAAAP